MRWSDHAHLLSVRPHGETSVIMEMMTHDHGRHFGLVPGGRSRRYQPLLQIGNTLNVEWSARLDEHLGSCKIEAVRLRTAELTQQAISLHGLGALNAFLRLLPERDPHPALFDAASAVLDTLRQGRDSFPVFVRFEQLLLKEMGFELDLETCAVTGQTHDLAYVSPKTGRAVSRQAGEDYRERLLPLPLFLQNAASQYNGKAENLSSAFFLTGFFLERNLLKPQGLSMPQERSKYLSYGHVQ
jgi:DNA repair protein RecO (recombination protein O)